MVLKASLQQLLKLVKAMTPGAPRIEFGQATLRVGVSAVVLAYVVYLGRHGLLNAELHALAAALAFFAFAVAIAGRILQAPGVSKSRRVLGIVVDNAVAS